MKKFVQILVILTSLAISAQIAQATDEIHNNDTAVLLREIYRNSNENSLIFDKYTKEEYSEVLSVEILHLIKIYSAKANEFLKDYSLDVYNSSVVDRDVFIKKREEEITKLNAKLALITEKVKQYQLLEPNHGEHFNKLLASLAQNF